MRWNALLLSRPSQDTESPRSTVHVKAPSRRRVGEFELVRTLAHGGMGNLHVAERRRPGGHREVVALKLLRSEFDGDLRVIDMFDSEAKLLLSLRHENIVRGIDAGYDDGVHWLAMELLEGMTLARLARDGLTDAIPLVARVRIVCDVLSALQYAHSHRRPNGDRAPVVHRDVSPQNIVVTSDGRVKLLDFGVAKSAERALRSDPGVLKGRASYMAPEQVTGDLVDRRTDIFAVGVVLRELLVGSRLWEGSSPTETLIRLARRDIPEFPNDAAIPRELREICDRAMAPELDDRFPNAWAMRACLDHHVARATTRVLLGAVGRDLAACLGSENGTTGIRERQPTEPAPDEATPGFASGEHAVEAGARQVEATVDGETEEEPVTRPRRSPRIFVDQTPTLRFVAAEVEKERRLAHGADALPPIMILDRAPAPRPIARSTAPRATSTDERPNGVDEASPASSGGARRFPAFVYAERTHAGTTIANAHAPTERSSAGERLGSARPPLRDAPPSLAMEALAAAPEVTTAHAPRREPRTRAWALFGLGLLALLLTVAIALATCAPRVLRLRASGAYERGATQKVTRVTTRPSS